MGRGEEVKNGILITGGTGTFGRAFVARLLYTEDCDRICIFSRGEHSQAQMRDEFDNDGRLRWFIGDVRDAARLRRAMEGCDVVVHAAALKRIEVGEYCPDELVKTNVGGALNVIDCAMSAGVRKVVALSTDKACAPVNAYGASKLLSEKLFLAANNMRAANGPIYAVTRYGNVAGSNGSVIPRWRDILRSGASEVPVTDPEATRFWMHIDEAVNLVLDTIRDMRGGELAIPTLPAYRLADLAEAMGARMKVIGMGEHEKRHESMRDGETSEHARRMTVIELREALAYV